MFNFFKRKKTATLPLPVCYTGIINQQEYINIVNLCKDFLINDGETILRVADGEIVLKDGEKEKRYFLDNLIRVLAQNQPKDWTALVASHFTKLKDVPFAMDYIFKDFDYAAQFLKILVRPDNFIGAENFVKRNHLPGTSTFLALDFNERFTYFTEEDAKDWNKTQDELFEIGFANISNEKIEIQELKVEGRFPVYAFFDGDFSASYIVELERNARFSIGSHGSVVAIPTKGSAFVHPIETKDVMDLVGNLAEITSPIFNEDPGGINSDFYWYFEGEFEIFPVVPAGDGYATIKLPGALLDRLESI